jgi:hypothetical protein
MKIFKIVAMTIGGSMLEQFVVAGNDIEAKRISEEDSEYDIEEIQSITEIDITNPCMLGEVEIN